MDIAILQSKIYAVGILALYKNKDCVNMKSAMKTVCIQQYTIQDEILSRVSFGETHFGKNKY